MKEKFLSKAIRFKRSGNAAYCTMDPLPIVEPQEPVNSSIVWNGKWSSPVENSTLVIPKAVCEPISIVYQPSSDKSSLRIVVEEGASVRILESFEGRGSFHTKVIMEIHSGGMCEYARMEPEYIELQSTFEAYLQANAQLFCTSVMQGLSSERTSCIYLQGQHARVETKSLSFALDSANHYIKSRVEHEQPKTFSDQLFKSVVIGSSTADSCVYVHPCAQQSETHQLSRFLALDECAKCVNKPSLQVCADDVIATHGATTGQIDEQMLFYFAARGICRRKAKELCIQGFCEGFLYE